MKLKINDSTILKIMKSINKINSSRTYKITNLKNILIKLYYDRLEFLTNIVHIIGSTIIHNEEIDIGWLINHYQEKINNHITGYNISDLILPFVQIWTTLKTFPLNENYSNIFSIWDYMIRIWVFYNFSECLKESDIF